MRLTCQNYDIELLFLTLLLFFCKSSNKNVLEWFLLIISKECNLTRSTNLLSRNHPTLCFWLRKDTQYILLTLWLEVQSSRSQMFFKINLLKNFAIFTRKNLCWSLFLIKLQTSRPVTLLKSNSSTGVFLRILRNF